MEHFLTTYVNNDAYFSIRDKKGMADGCIIVKEIILLISTSIPSP